MLGLFIISTGCPELWVEFEAAFLGVSCPFAVVTKERFFFRELSASLAVPVLLPPPAGGLELTGISDMVMSCWKYSAKDFG